MHTGDVFTAKRFGGNQLAIFTDAAGLSATEMQSLAHELNFSESTFVSAPEIAAAVRRVRIFTPRVELPMAGHPTVGTAWVLASRGEIVLEGPSTVAILQLEIGPISVAVEGVHRQPEFVWMTHREPTYGAIRDDRARIASALGIDPADIRGDLPIQIVSTGVPFLFVPIKSVEALGRCAPNGPALAALFDAHEEKLALHMFAIGDSREFGVRARMFAPHTVGIAEDPATGGAAGPFGA
ncbi:MAG: PhzF family phenazine biosynthesis protein [Candidatus Binatus sp.]|nr:PhzF family phenazine biosynthesis protein [Candidatus Binatus sp.]MDO8434402.1 PhzF family phenazine biosynthesis protein [Candidatus Binatus sp.]